MTVDDIFDYTESFAPINTCADFDNCGILVGDKNQTVTKVLVALDITSSVVDEAKKIARNESDLMLKEARIQIQQEKANALREIKNQVAILSVDIAGVLLKSELEASPKQQALIENYLKDVTFN